MRRSERSPGSAPLIFFVQGLVKNLRNRISLSKVLQLKSKIAMEVQSVSQENLCKVRINLAFDKML